MQKSFSAVQKSLLFQNSLFNFSRVNQFYIPNKAHPIKFTPKSNKWKGLRKNHRSESWTKDEVMQSTKDHVVFTWGATDAMRDSSVAYERGEGIYLYDYEGNKYIDFTS